MYKSYVLETKIEDGLIAEGMYLDVNNPYHYFRIDKGQDQDRMIIGGEDVKAIFKVDKDKSFGALQEYLRSILSGIKFEITKQWSGPILEPSDGIALIGETYPNEYVATAFSGNGMTYAAISANIISDLILGQTNAYARLYDPKRIPNIKQLVLKGVDYVEEALGAAAKNVLRKKGAQS
jgi:glycine/D-amino acid oxidase-like deaminating enzyme